VTVISGLQLHARILQIFFELLDLGCEFIVLGLVGLFELKELGFVGLELFQVHFELMDGGLVFKLLGALLFKG